MHTMFRIVPRMNAVAQVLEAIDAKAEEIGLPELARRADVPYTTLVDLKKKAWRPRSIAILERLADAASGGRRSA